MRPDEFVKGTVYKRDDLISAFGGGFYGGINVSHKTKSVVLLSARYDNPDYADSFHNGFYKYTGEGQRGDQELKGKNKTLFNAKKLGYKIYLFLDYKRTEHTYYGEYEIIGNPDIEYQIDADGKNRKVLMFTLCESNSIRRMTPDEIQSQITAGPIKPTVKIAGARLDAGENILCSKITSGDLINQIEFPSVKIASEESPQDAIKRMMKEKYDVEVKVSEFVGNSSYEYEKAIVDLSVYKCSIISGDIAPKLSKNEIWQDRKSIADLDWNEVSVPIVDEIVEEENLKIDNDLVQFNYFEMKPNSESSDDDNRKKRAVMDYERAMRNQARAGANAEIAVLMYEKDKFLNSARPDLADKVERVSLKSSDYGYDIKSLIYKDGKYVESHIEVKKVKVTDSYLTFFISAHELEKFRADKNYFIYCVFKSGKKYKLHIVDRNMFTNACLTPLTYQVKIKIKE